MLPVVAGLRRRAVGQVRAPEIYHGSTVLVDAELRVALQAFRVVGREGVLHTLVAGVAGAADDEAVVGDGGRGGERCAADQRDRRVDVHLGCAPLRAHHRWGVRARNHPLDLLIG